MNSHILNMFIITETFYARIASGIALQYKAIPKVRCHGGQNKRFKDTLEASMKDFGINHKSWETLAQDRLEWRSAIHKGTAAYEQQCIETAKTKRAARKARCINPPAQAPAPLFCPHCASTFQARIGLISHLRTHPVP